MTTRSIPGTTSGAAGIAARSGSLSGLRSDSSFSPDTGTGRLVRVVALAAAAYSAYMAFRALQTLRSERPDTQRTDDVALDEALSETFPASDPVTSY